MGYSLKSLGLKDHLDALKTDSTKKISLKEMAKRLSISPAAVSKALNDYPDISLATKKIVKSYAKKVGYKANSQASFLRSQKSKTIGVIIPDITNPFYSKILKAILISFVYFVLGIVIFYLSYSGAKNRGTLINMGE